MESTIFFSSSNNKTLESVVVVPSSFHDVQSSIVLFLHANSDCNVAEKLCNDVPSYDANNLV